MKMRTAAAGLLTLTGLAATTPAWAGTVRTVALNTPFTVAWTDDSSKEQHSITATVTSFRCGKDTAGDVELGRKAAAERYGQFADPQPAVEPGHQLCTAQLTIVNSGRKKAQHNPAVTALDATGVEFSEDDAFTRWVGTGVTHYQNRDSSGGDTVDFNPRQTARSAVAFLIPLDTRVTTLRYAGEAYPMVDTAQVNVTVV
ncbi:hypothetical protein [Actinoplanes sp. M2I2]|uniref:hypothetical protein n=1 Tax=Actinoplanes sp. M2I2 TaxID=1734444 RepID=UPI00201FDD36|nr:hypothetical protein [Actinoplanes sp. M2I2]